VIRRAQAAMTIASIGAEEATIFEVKASRPVTGKSPVNAQGAAAIGNR